MVEFRPPVDTDLQYIAQHMREADRREVWACGRADPLHALRASVNASTHLVLATWHGRPAAVMGLAPISLLEGLAAPWMLGTDDVPDNGRVLMAHSRPYIQAMLREYPHLVNLVHAPNVVAVRWLRRVGFTLHPAEPHGPHGEMFHRFEMRA